MLGRARRGAYAISIYAFLVSLQWQCTATSGQSEHSDVLEHPQQGALPLSQESTRASHFPAVAVGTGLASVPHDATPALPKRLPDLNEPWQSEDDVQDIALNVEQDAPVTISSDSSDSSLALLMRQGRKRGSHLAPEHYRALRAGASQFSAKKRKQTESLQRVHADDVGMEKHEDYVYRPRTEFDPDAFESRKRRAYNNKFRRKAREREAYLDMIKRFGDLKGLEKFREFKDHMERLQRLRSVNSMRRQVGWPDIPDVETYERLRAEGVTICPSRTQLAHRTPIPRLKRDSDEYKLREQLRTCNRARQMCGWKTIPDGAKYKEMREAGIQTYPPTDLLMQAKVRLQLAQGKPLLQVKPPPGEVERRREQRKLRGRLRTVNHFRKLVGFSEIPNVEEFVRLRNEGAAVYPPNWLIRQARAKAILAREALPQKSTQAPEEYDEQARLGSSASSRSEGLASTDM